MGDLFRLSEARMERLGSFVSRPHGRPRVVDQGVLSGIVFVNRNGLRWRDALEAYGSAKTPYNRVTRCSRMGAEVDGADGSSAGHS